MRQSPRQFTATARRNNTKGPIAPLCTKAVGIFFLVHLLFPNVLSEGVTRLFVSHTLAITVSGVYQAMRSLSRPLFVVTFSVPHRKLTVSFGFYGHTM